MANVDWDKLNASFWPLMQGLLASPFVADPSRLTGDADANANYLLAGSATTPRSDALKPGVPYTGAAAQPAAAAPTQFAGVTPPAQVQPAAPQAASATPEAPAPTQFAGLPGMPKWLTPEGSQFSDQVRSLMEMQAGKTPVNADFSEYIKLGLIPQEGMSYRGSAPPAFAPGGYGEDNRGSWVLTNTGSQTFGGPDSGQQSVANNEYVWQPAQQQIPADLMAQVRQLLGAQNG